MAHHFFENRFALFGPDVLVCLGNFASQWVLKTDKGVTALRGKLHQAGHFVVAPTFHPAATIYHPDWEPLLIEDLRRVGDVAGQNIQWKEMHNGSRADRRGAFYFPFT